MSEFVLKDALVADNLVRLTKPNKRLAMFLAHFRQGFRLEVSVGQRNLV